MKKIKLILFLLIFLFPTIAFALTGAPEAHLTVNQNLGNFNTIFLFDASNSIDAFGRKENLEFRFLLSRGESDFTAWQKEPTIKHKYNTDGVKTIILEVRDKEGRTDSVFTQITISKSLVLAGQMGVDKTEGTLDTEFNFYVTMFTQGGQSAEGYEFRWDFENDGIFDTAFQKTAAISHFYNSTGWKLPVVEIRDKDGQTLKLVGYFIDDRKKIGDIFVTNSKNPTASFTVFPKEGKAKETIFYFDASLSSSEANKDDIELRFDFENDGQFDIEFSKEKKFTHIYETKGEKTILLQVKSSSGKIDSTTQKIIIYEEDSLPYPDLIISNDNSNFDSTSGTLATTFTLNASNSRDLEDGTPNLEARFDFDGDGLYDTLWSKEKIAKHRYAKIGTFKATVEIKDLKGNRASIYKQVTIVENEFPEGIIEVAPLSGTPKTNFVFTLSNVKDSQNLNGFIESRIDYEGDNIFDTDFYNVRRYEHIYSKVGRFSPIIQLRDKYGKTNDLKTSIIIFDSSYPDPFFEVAPNSGTYQTQFFFDGSQSFDRETKNLKYRWDFDYTGANDINFDTAFSTNPKTYYRFSGTPGERRIRLEVEDEEGLRSSAIKSIFLHWGSPYLEKLLNRGILTGGMSMDLRPDDKITRAELVKIIVKGAGLEKYQKPYRGYFSDVKNNDWAWIYVEIAKDYGIVDENNTKLFRPNENVNRAEALKIILKGFRQLLVNNCQNKFADMQTKSWYDEYVCTAYELGIVKGYDDKKFHPERDMTRAEAAKIVSMLLK